MHVPNIDKKKKKMIYATYIVIGSNCVIPQKRFGGVSTAEHSPEPGVDHRANDAENSVPHPKKQESDQTLISTSTPLGNSSFISASIVFEVEL